MFRRGAPPQATFIFKHALVQDTAYGTLLRRPRRELHARIAVALERQFSEIVEQRPESARTPLRGGRPRRQGRTILDPGRRPGGRALHQPRGCGRRYRAALRIVDEQPSTAPIRQIEAELCMKLGNALMQFEGYSSIGAIEAYRRGSTSAAALDQPESYAKAAIGLAPLLFSDCRYQEVRETLEGISANLLGRLRPQTCVHLFTMSESPIIAWAIFWSLGMSLTRPAGSIRSPRAPTKSEGGAIRLSVPPKHMGMSGAVLGRLEESATLTQEGLALARARNDAFTLAWALLGQVRLHRALGRFAEGIPIANEAVNICERHGFRARLGSVLIVRGILHFELGDIERGLTEMCRGIDVWRETSGRFHLSEWLSYLVDRLIRADRRDEADTFLLEGERIVDETTERSHVADLRRLRGNMLYRDGAVHAAAICLEQAIDCASRQHAKVLELRARRDLARLHIGEGRPKVAGEVLNHALSLFPKELVFPDLLETRELLRACA